MASPSFRSAQPPCRTGWWAVGRTEMAVSDWSGSLEGSPSSRSAPPPCTAHTPADKRGEACDFRRCCSLDTLQASAAIKSAVQPQHLPTQFYPLQNRLVPSHPPGRRGGQQHLSHTTLQIGPSLRRCPRLAPPAGGAAAAAAPAAAPARGAAEQRLGQGGCVGIR